jgi:hypothetical protein
MQEPRLGDHVPSLQLSAGASSGRKEALWTSGFVQPLLRSPHPYPAEVAVVGPSKGTRFPAPWGKIWRAIIQVEQTT